jgi:four helix bundle protein
VSKLSDCEAEAAETQTWLEFAVRCEYLAPETGRAVFKSCDEIIAMLVAMINNSESWVLPSIQKRNVQ